MELHDVLKKYEKAVYIILIALFALIVACSIGELIYILYVALFVNSPFLLQNGELLGIFGYFLLVLIGVELLGTITTYVNESVIHVETVLIISIIAIAREVILLDVGSENPVNMFGIAAIILALCAGYYLLEKGGIRNP
jgi:uncharacterized membrane protein (DUF373 family)